MMPGFQSPNYTQAPNDWFDVYLRLQGYAEMKVTAAIMRHTLGFHKKRCELSLTAICRLTGLAESNAIKGAEAAEARGLIRRTNRGGGKRRRTVWELVIGAPPSTSATEVVPAATSVAEVALPLQQRQTTSATEGRLNKTKRNHKDTSTAAAALLTPPAAAAAAHGDWWGWGTLISAGKLSAERRAALLEADKPSAGAYVSKYLYALTRPTMNKPALWAASQISAEPGAWEGEPYEGLAALGPRPLAAVLAWLRDDCREPLAASEALPLALALRADLQSKYQKNPSRLYAAAAEALADLGLMGLAGAAPSSAELALEQATAPPPAPPDEWARLLGEWQTNGLINSAVLDRLSRCRLTSAEAGAYRVSVPTPRELEFFNRKLALFSRSVNIAFSLERED